MRRPVAACGAQPMSARGRRRRQRASQGDGSRASGTPIQWCAPPPADPANSEAVLAVATEPRGVAKPLKSLRRQADLAGCAIQRPASARPNLSYAELPGRTDSPLWGRCESCWSHASQSEVSSHTCDSCSDFGVGCGRLRRLLAIAQPTSASDNLWTGPYRREYRRHMGHTSLRVGRARQRPDSHPARRRRRRLHAGHHQLIHRRLRGRRRKASYNHQRRRQPLVVGIETDGGAFTSWRSRNHLFTSTVRSIH